jgi:hypothetical protein
MIESARGISPIYLGTNFWTMVSSFRWEISSLTTVSKETSHLVSRFLLDLFKREAPKTSTTQLGRTIMSYMEYSQQKYVIHVIYGPWARTLSCNFCFPGSDPFGLWNLLGTIRASCVCQHNFSDKNNLEIQEEKTFTSSYMIDVCIEKAITPKPANYKLPSPKQRWKKYVRSKVHSDYTEGLYVLTWSWNLP